MTHSSFLHLLWLQTERVRESFEPLWWGLVILHPLALWSALGSQVNEQRQDITALAVRCGEHPHAGCVLPSPPSSRENGDCGCIAPVFLNLISMSISPNLERLLICTFLVIDSEFDVPPFLSVQKMPWILFPDWLVWLALNQQTSVMCAAMARGKATDL